MEHSLPIDTLGRLMMARMRAYGCCLDCQHFGDIDLAALAARVGEDWVFINRHWPVKCGRCASRNVETRIAGK